jgi:sigma-B regulation protein RsbU (phosphoserine phosphatase)
MELRTRLMLSYLAVVAVFALGMVLLVEFGVSELGARSLMTVREGSHEIAVRNYQFSEQVLSQHLQDMVWQRTTALARSLQPRLTGRTAADYPALRRDADLREVLATPFLPPGSDTGPRTRPTAGHFLLLDKRGRVVISRDTDLEGLDVLDHRSVPAGARWLRRLAELGQVEFTGEVRPATGPADGPAVTGKMLVGSGVPGTSFVLVAVVDQRLYFAPLREQLRVGSRRASNITGRELTDAIQQTQLQMRIVAIEGLLVLAVVGVLFALSFARMIAEPINELRDAVQRIGKGNFATRVREGGAPVLRDLARSFNQLGSRLTDYMENLRRETAARQAVQSELQVAGQIQQALLPDEFDPLGERDDLALYATNDPARDVGGDLFDFFRLGEDRLALLVGDVSGKGVPASLYMAMTRTIFRMVCRHHEDPAGAVTEANEMLCRESAPGMFVTLLLAYYNAAEGRVLYCNAGHNPPLILRADGAVEELDEPHGTILGAACGMRFGRGRFELAPGETAVVYTDGVTEAMGDGRERFGIDRLQAVLRKHAALSPRELCDAVVRAVNDFQGEDAFDDITLLAWKHSS